MPSGLPKAVRNAVFKKFITDNECCFCCRLEPITLGNFQCGHVIAESKGGLGVLRNLRPICALCNLSMGTTNMFEFIETYGFWGEDSGEIVAPVTLDKIFSRLDELGETLDTIVRRLDDIELYCLEDVKLETKSPYFE